MGKETEKRDATNYAKLNASMNQIANCFGYLITHLSKQSSGKSETIKDDPVILLHSFGFARDQISSITNITIEAINMRISRSGKTRKTPRKNKKENGQD